MILVSDWIFWPSCSRANAIDETSKNDPSETSTVVSSEDDSSWWLFLLVVCVMVFYVPSAPF
jgi:hypothetical protein